jgi:hypothetical protein
MSPVGPISINIFVFGNGVVAVDIRNVIEVSAVISGWSPNGLIADVDVNASTHGPRACAVHGEKYAADENHGAKQKETELRFFHIWSSFLL